MDTSNSSLSFSDAEIEEFRAIWKKEFKEEITVEQARREAFLLMELYSLLIEPVPEGESDVKKVRFPAPPTPPRRVMDIVPPKKKPMM
ncbi:MAG: hypothetical protein HY286_09270 [Planctomycetes bacterium]|nr:hypothetical protein [Planctomycetota bacterium]